MKHVAKTLTDMSEQLADEDLARVCGGFNPQPDPPGRVRTPSLTSRLQPLPEGDRLARGNWGSRHISHRAIMRRRVGFPPLRQPRANLRDAFCRGREETLRLTRTQRRYR